MNAVNGHSVEVKMLRQVIQAPGTNVASKVIYTLSNGAYLGTISFDCVNNDAMKMMTADFQAFISEATGGIVQVPAGARLPSPGRTS